MNTNKHHELLCALVLGELPPGPERELIESALAESPELRAEKERIEGTIGLVSRAFEGDAKLSSNAAERLLAAAKTGPVSRTENLVKPALGLRLLGEDRAPLEGWRSQDSLRAAAGFALFLSVAFAGYQATGGGEERKNEYAYVLGLKGRPVNRSSHSIDRSGIDTISILDAFPPASASLETESSRLQSELAKVDSQLSDSGATIRDEDMEIALLERRAYGGLNETQAQAERSRDLLERAKSLKLREAEASADSTGAEASDLQRELHELTNSVARHEGATITHVELPKPKELDDALRSIAPTPAAAADPAVPQPKARKRKGKMREHSTGGLPIAGLKGGEAATSTATVGAVTEDASQVLAGVAGRVLLVDELTQEAQLDSDSVDMYFELGVPVNLPSTGFVTDSPFDAKSFNTVIGIGGGAQGAQFGASADTIWSYLEAQPLDFEAKLELAKRIALQPFTPLPGESPQTLYTRFYGENPFFDAREDALSTFGIDVDDASWLRARASLRSGLLPDPRSIRVEEFVNAFRPDVPAPENGETFALAFEAMPQRFGSDPNRLLLRVALRGKEVTSFERKPLQLTFVVDVSGSMDEPNRLPLVKDTLALLVDQLGSGDSISIVSFSSEAKIVQPMVSVANRTQILAAIDSLEPDGGTNAEAGLVVGYEIAAAQVAQGITSRVVLLSDGIANLGETDQARLTDRVAKERESGVFLNTVGVGLEAGGDAFLEQLADRGDGMATWMQDAEGARRSLIENFTGAFETIARDVKIQVEFDPRHTARWRQIGYENRAIADKDFRNDKVDAGEVGAGHQIVALYEVELARGIHSNRMPLAGESFATVRVRWKSPEGDEVQELERPADIGSVAGWEGTSAGMKRSVIAARFAEILRRSKHASSIDLNDLALAAQQLNLSEADPDLSELQFLIEAAMPLVAALPEPDAELEPLFEALRDNALRKARYQLAHPLANGAANQDSLKGPRDDDPAWVDLGRERQDLEQRITDVLRKRLKAVSDR